jgi:hypothetical protein
MSDINVQKRVADILRNNKKLISIGNGEQLYDVLTESLDNVNNIYPYIAELTDILSSVMGVGGVIMLFNEFIPTGTFNHYNFPVEKLTLPSTIRSIRTSAFSAVDGVKVFTANGVSEVYLHSFMNMRSLETLNLPNLRSISTSAFHGCSKLNEMYLGQNLEAIGNGAFEDCTQLDKIFLPATIHTIGHSAFKGTPLTDVYYAGTLKEWDTVMKKCVGAFYKAGKKGNVKIHCKDGDKKI